MFRTLNLTLPNLRKCRRNFRVLTPGPLNSHPKAWKKWASKARRSSQDVDVPEPEEEVQVQMQQQHLAAARAPEVQAQVAAAVLGTTEPVEKKGNNAGPEQQVMLS